LSAQEPKKEIYEFAGNFKELKEDEHEHNDDMTHAESLSLEVHRDNPALPTSITSMS
jgi:hypothetical protein